MCEAEENQNYTLIGLMLFIACGLLVITVSVILAKRQIMRFALKSKTGQHIPVCHDVSKQMKDETRRRLSRTQDIGFEPYLLGDGELRHSTNAVEHEFPHIYRMKAVDECKGLEIQIMKYRCCTRLTNESFDEFLQNHIGIVSRKTSQSNVDDLCKLYRHACHEPEVFDARLYNRVAVIVSNLNHLLIGGRKEQSQAFRPIADIDEITDDVDVHKSSASQFNLPFKQTVLSLANKMFYSKKKKREYQSVPSTESIDEINETSPL